MHQGRNPKASCLEYLSFLPSCELWCSDPTYDFLAREAYVTPLVHRLK